MERIQQRRLQLLAWLYVLGAAIVEVFWVIGLKYSDSVLDWLGTMIAIIFSFYQPPIYIGKEHEAFARAYVQMVDKHLARLNS